MQKPKYAIGQLITLPLQSRVDQRDADVPLAITKVVHSNAVPKVRYRVEGFTDDGDLFTEDVLTLKVDTEEITRVALAAAAESPVPV